MEYDYDGNIFPLAYLITIRTYGTWLPGDARESISRRQNRFRSPKRPANADLEKSSKTELVHKPTRLRGSQRKIVREAIEEVCEKRGYFLRAINVRTNHAHSVVSAQCEPEGILNAFKAYATRRLREARAIPKGSKIWVRRGSRRYLWKPRHVSAAIDYLLFGQGDELPEFDD